MGKLKVEGKALRRVQYDEMEITIKFQIEERSSSKALKRTMDECEDFLNKINLLGIKIENINLEDNEVDQTIYSDDISVIGTRSIKVLDNFDMKFINDLSEIIYKNDYNVDIKIDYILSTENEINKELLLEALDDSRNKAEMIASSLGQQIKGIDKAELNDNSYSSIDTILEHEDVSYKSSKYELSDQLEAPIAELYKKINVEWIIE